MADGNIDCTVVVGSCDKYADLLGPFIALFRKFWPDCPFEVVLVTEHDPHIEGFDRTIACGGGMNWGGGGFGGGGGGMFGGGNISVVDFLVKRFEIIRSALKF